MLPKIKIALTATLLSSVALVPVTVIGYVASADMAYAKSDNAGGNGKGNSGKSASNGSKGKSASAGNPGRGNGNGKLKAKGNSGKEFASRGNGQGNRGLKGMRDDLKQAGQDVRGLFRKMTGQKPQKTKSASYKSNGNGKNRISATVASIDGDTRPAVRDYGDKYALPRNTRGNMNGALNANENAIAAMLRNGNRNGPVGLMAGYVEGRAITADAIEDLGPDAIEYIAINKHLIEAGFVDGDGVPDLQAYLDSDAEIEKIDTILDDLQMSAQDQLLIDNGFVDEEGNPDRDAYEMQEIIVIEDYDNLTDEDRDQALIDAGFVDMDGNPDSDAYENQEIVEIEGFEDATDFDDEIYADVNDRTDDLTAAHDAQDDLVYYWNKGDGATEEEEEALRDLLAHRAMYVEETGVVMDSLPDLDEDDMDDDDEMVENPCEGGEEVCTTDEEVAQLPQ